MASDKSDNSDGILHTNVRVKIEPGTSTSVSSVPLDNNTPLRTTRNIKMEPGLPITTQRLTSFRLPRDFTLSGNIKTEKPKKIYTPNFNAQRNKKKDEAVPVKTDSRSRDSGSGRDRGRGRGRSDRGRGKGNLIQSVGIWSEGINAPTVSKRYSSTRDSNIDIKRFLDKSRLNSNKTIDKTEEDKIKNLLKDDFVDDGTDNMDNDFITLPMIDKENLHKKDIKTETDETCTDEEDIDRKPVILENGEAIVAKKEQKLKTERLNEEKIPINQIPQIIENKTNSYILIQFPSCLPGLESNIEEPKVRRPNCPKVNNENGDKIKTEYCTLNSLKGGHLGKLQILKSGKARLVLGENNLIVDIGSHSCFRQDLLAAKVDLESLKGDLINLGPISNTLVFSPDLKSILANS